jgi:hypothetical protein
MDLLLIKEGFPLLSFLIFLPLAGAVVSALFSRRILCPVLGIGYHLDDRHLLAFPADRF